jgi:Na+-transporting NADH:ubiquinone oxidoreductase subunit C
MNRESNKFILIFASIIVVIVALALSLAHEALKDTQNRNVEIDKKLQILRSIHVNVSAKDAEKEYARLITAVFAVDTGGNKKADTPEAVFGIDMKTELAKPAEERRYPVFVAVIDGATKYVMALAGKGLWGDIWGYVSVNADGNTIYGADFSHAGETPGLGAEITNPLLSGQFAGKHLFRDGEFRSVAVVKKGKADVSRDYVDGISGGTLTGKGLDRALLNSLEGYSNFLKKIEQ